jgi:hypothetical protein
MAGYLPFGTNTTAANISAGAIIYTSTIGASQTIKRYHQGIYVVTTNNGSNYWTIILRRADTLAALISLSTAASAANTILTLSSVGDVAITTGMLNVYVEVAKVGSPGNLYLYGPAVYVI